MEFDGRGRALGGRSEGGVLWWWPRAAQYKDMARVWTCRAHIAEDQVAGIR